MLGNVGTHAQNQTLYKAPLYNAVTDFAPVVLIMDQSLVLVARNDFPANNLQEFIAYAKANQSKMQYGSSGAGGSNHLACVLLNAAIGINVTHIPYRGGGQAMQDLLAGRVDYQCPSAPTAMPQITGKTVKAIAILSKNRSPSLPDSGIGARARADRLRHPELVRAVPAERHAGRDRPQAERRRRRRHEHAVDAGPAEGDRLRPGWAGAQVAGIPRQVRRRRDQEMGRPDRRQRRPVLRARERAMRLHELTLRTVRLPLIRPYVLSYRTFTEFEPIIVEVRDGDGRIGWGEGHISPGSSSETREGGWAFCREHAAALIGKDDGRGQGDHRRQCRRQQSRGDGAAHRDRDA